MRPIKTVLLAIAVLSVATCGSDSPIDPGDEPSGPGTGSFSAQVGGQAWSAATRSATHVNGTLTLNGTDASQRTLHIGIANVTAPGTFQLAQGNPNGAIASVIEGAAIWSSSVAGGSGTLTVSILTATRVAGTFTFSGSPATATATGSRVVTAGQFDLGK